MSETSIPLGSATASGLTEPKQRAVMYRCLVCRTDTFSPTGIGVQCAKCNDWTRCEVVWVQPS